RGGRDPGSSVASREFVPPAPRFVWVLRHRIPPHSRGVSLDKSRHISLPVSAKSGRNMPSGGRAAPAGVTSATCQQPVFLVHPAPVARAGCALPRSPGLGLKPLRVAGIAPVQQAVAERVLAGEVRAYAQFPLGLAGDDGVLVIAEDRLDLLHLAGEPAGPRAQPPGHPPPGVAGAPPPPARLLPGPVPGPALRRPR